MATGNRGLRNLRLDDQRECWRRQIINSNYHVVRGTSQGRRTWSKATKSVEKNKTTDLLKISRHAIPGMHRGMLATNSGNSEQLMFSTSLVQLPKCRHSRDMFVIVLRSPAAESRDEHLHVRRLETKVMPSFSSLPCSNRVRGPSRGMRDAHNTTFWAQFFLANTHTILSIVP
jgi:hypothetical protein